jgi:putative phosphoribosyl transferase
VGTGGPHSFRDRRDAGRWLAGKVEALDLDAPVVLGLPRGGIPVAAEVADALGAPMEIFVARKIGCPGHEELGVGAIAEGGEPVFDIGLLQYLGLVPADLAGTVEAERAELARRVQVYRGDRPLPMLKDAVVVVVDDGLATGVTARAALAAVRRHEPRRLVLAAPVGAADTIQALTGLADDVVVVLAPRHFGAVSRFYERFEQLTDSDVLAAVSRSRHR